MPILPPGGFAGFQQMTPASRAALFPRGRSTKRKAAKPRKARKARKSAKARKRGGMKFGSPVWQKKYKVGKFAKKR